MSLPVREVDFRVKVPENTPPGETVYVTVLPFDDWAWNEEQHTPMKPEGSGIWSARVSVEEGALVRYVYDRWDAKEWSKFKETREASGKSISIESRYLFVEPGLAEVRDTVDTWNDLRALAPTGAVHGIVLDGATGSPLMDTNISIAGIHIASDYDGRFKLEGVAAGVQRVTAHRNLGDYRPAATTAEVTAGGVAEVRIEMQAAPPVDVTFDVALPENTPADAEISLAGSVFQLGARPGVQPNMPIMAGHLLLPKLERVGAGRARVTLRLHGGTYVQYFYSIGSSSRGREYGAETGFVYRSFLVDPSSPVRQDRVATWRPGGGAVRVTLRVAVPPNSPPDTPVVFNAGPSHWMTRTGSYEWTIFLYGFPGEQEPHRYVLGDDNLGADGSDGLGEDGTRTLVYPIADAVVEDRVERWKWTPTALAVAPGQPAEVTFRVTVPPSTPRDASIRLVGEHSDLRSGVAMTQEPGNPWAYHASVQLPGGETVSYWYDRAAPVSRSERSFGLTVKLRDQEVNDWVTGWSDQPSGPQAKRLDFITGVYTPDWWADAFLRLSSRTFDRIKAHNGGWVVVSSVWHFGQLDPPVVESRRVKAPSVLTPREDIISQARLAREKGLKVVLGPQFNMEMLPGGLQAVCRTQSRDWLEAWLVEAERLWMWNAAVAQEIAADAMLVPGYCFHVYAGGDDGTGYSVEFDKKVGALIQKVRGVFHGKLIVSGGRQDFDFPGLADLVGVTTFDTGQPDLPYDATVDEWKAAYDALFVEKVDPIHRRWGKPVLFYTVHLPPVPGDPSPTGAEAQARRLEAIFQALESRLWVAGILSWDYSMIDTPLYQSTGVRARQAEAVLAKYYALWTQP
ncbi:MAG: hypothetical protein HYY01_12330 [Chloroflexi bacterium]|nr:hypothetical protein [Chloroflexota bacterium]